MDDKIIVSNRSALNAKYGARGLAKIAVAIKVLIDADAKRGITSRFVYLDDAEMMSRFRGRAVTKRSSTRQNKAAIDAIFKSSDPEYLMILGAPDVVPHQDLTNPVFAAGDDDDKDAIGDLPYACEAPYSRDVAAFTGPTRVVGRLPDLTGANEPSYLLEVLKIAANHETRAAKAYEAYFGLSTQSWRKSTELSLFNLFGNSDLLTLSPPNGPKHPAKRLAPLAHFINCHGAKSDPAFYGERGDDFPESLTSSTIKGRIKGGTVAAAECCYGAELYDSVTPGLPLPICQQYLKQGAYGFFGSSTIAYGPSEGNGEANLITQYFLLAVADGASLGRAALLARQKFVEQTGELDPVDLKTLAQFSLLGDPSIHPAKVYCLTGVPKGVTVADSKRYERRERRARLRSAGEFLRTTKPTASRKSTDERQSPTVAIALASIAREAGINKDQGFAAYDVQCPVDAKAKVGKTRPMASRYYVAVYRPKAAGAQARSIVAVAKEAGGRIVGYRIYGEK